MRVLHYIDENRLSWAKAWINLLDELTCSGVDNFVVCKSGGTLSNLLIESGIHFCTCDVPIAFLPFTAMQFRKIVNAVRPDIIHSRLSSAARIAGWWGMHMGVPVISTIDKFAKGYYYKKASFLIPCSTAVRDHMADLGFDLSKMRVIHNCVNVALYKPEIDVRKLLRKKYNISANMKLMLSAGWFSEGKGFEFAIRAYALCLNKHPELASMSSFHLVGNGAEQAKYINLINELNMGNKIFLHPFVEDIRPWLWAADFFVQPSFRPEGFSLMLLEAMAAGVPAIATGIGGTLDIIKNEENGWLCEPKEYVHLADIIATVICNQRLKLVADNALLSVSDFGVKNIAAETVNLYEQFL